MIFLCLFVIHNLYDESLCRQVVDHSVLIDQEILTKFLEEYLRLSCSSDDFVKFLIKKGANVNPHLSDGSNTISDWNITGHDILDSKLYKDVTLSKTRYPIHLAILHENIAVVQALVTNGASLHVCNFNGDNVLESAKRLKNQEVYSYLYPIFNSAPSKSEVHCTNSPDETVQVDKPPKVLLKRFYSLKFDKKINELTPLDECIDKYSLHMKK